ncbi:hypothetical protein NDU88_004101 [Pleurodeles waltl]|uniref:Uncharacterized protein n=1 Tax=Pleurodeles waltl TaxID=8319 RepID=A0AAV7M608_PLEWA|nr:hypothetical protein NDU88_004101 [Pleurodeles waltl]
MFCINGHMNTDHPAKQTFRLGVKPTKEFYTTTMYVLGAELRGTLLLPLPPPAIPMDLRPPTRTVSITTNAFDE